MWGEVLDDGFTLLSLSLSLSLSLNICFFLYDTQHAFPFVL
jgi:hypothetical protein